MVPRRDRPAGCCVEVLTGGRRSGCICAGAGRGEIDGESVPVRRDLHCQRTCEEHTIFVTLYGGGSSADGPWEARGECGMPRVRLTRSDFLADRQARTFADVINDPQQPFDEVLEFFNDADRQRRMVESELHHDRPPLAGVVRELEAQPDINKFLGGHHTRRNTRFRQAVGVLVRMIMERQGWQKTGRKGSLGVRAVGAARTPAHNTGGLAFWFIRAERYQRSEGMPFQSVRDRCKQLESIPQRKSTKGKRTTRS